MAEVYNERERNRMQKNEEEEEEEKQKKKKTRRMRNKIISQECEIPEWNFGTLKNR